MCRMPAQVVATKENYKRVPNPVEVQALFTMLAQEAFDSYGQALPRHATCIPYMTRDLHVM